MCGVCGEKGHSQKTCLHNYSKLERVSSKNHECSICLTKGNKAFCKTECGHYFHITCIKEWLKDNTTCPMCRYQLTEHSEKDLVTRIIEALFENMDPNIVLRENVIELYFENEILI
tara:strand:- start:302 stop:649 length:348 start_codon:yes stop_codon:yes gene_type:complete